MQKQVSYVGHATKLGVGHCVIARRAHRGSYWLFLLVSNLTCCNHASAHLGQCKKGVSCKVMLQDLLNFLSVCCSNSYHFIIICCVHVSQQMCCFWMLFGFVMCVPVLNADSNISYLSCGAVPISNNAFISCDIRMVDLNSINITRCSIVTCCVVVNEAGLTLWRR